MPCQAVLYLHISPALLALGTLETTTTLDENNTIVFQRVIEERHGYVT